MNHTCQQEDDREIEYIKEEFSWLLGKAITWKSTGALPIQEEKEPDYAEIFKLSNFFVPDEVIAEEVYKHLQLWIKTTLTIDNILLLHTGILNRVKFCSRKQIEDCRELFLELQSVLNKFACGVIHKVESHLFYQGSEEKGQLDKLLKNALEGGIDDLECLDLSPNNMFTNYVEILAEAGFRKLTIAFLNDNKTIFQKELALAQHCFTEICNCYRGKLSAYNCGKPSKIEAINHRLINGCINALKSSLESPDKINIFLVQVIEQLMTRMQKVYKEEAQSNRARPEQGYPQLSPNVTPMDSTISAETEIHVIKKLFHLYVMGMQVRIKGDNDPSRILKAHREAIQEVQENEEFTRLSEESKKILSQRQTYYVEAVLGDPPKNKNHEKVNHDPDSGEEAATDTTIHFEDSSTLVFYINNKLEVTMAIRQQPSDRAYQVLNNHLGEMHTSGVVAYTPEAEDRKMVIGSEARSLHELHKENVLIWDLFRLICTETVDEKWRKVGVKTFFLILRIHAEKMLNTTFSQVIVTFPDWFPANAHRFLCEVLREATFIKVRTLMETTAVAAAYLESRCALSPSRLPDWNWPFQIFSQSRGFTQVTIVGPERDEQPIKYLAMENNRKEIEHDFVAWFSKWFENSNKAVETSFTDWREKANKIYLKAFENFGNICDYEQIQTWQKSQLDCIIISDQRNLLPIENFLKEHGRTNVNSIPIFANWQQLVLQGATLFSFEDTGLFNTLLLGKNGTKNHRPAISETLASFPEHSAPAKVKEKPAPVPAHSDPDPVKMKEMPATSLQSTGPAINKKAPACSLENLIPANINDVPTSSPENSLSLPTRAEQFKQKLSKFLNSIELNLPRLSERVDVISEMCKDIREAQHEVDNNPVPEVVDYHETIINMHWQHYNMLLVRLNKPFIFHSFTYIPVGRLNC